jgi:transposase
VLCVDEKSQCQALERTQRMLPMGFGYMEGVTHDYVRHGTTTLFAALNVLNGAVLATGKSRHRHQEFLSLLREIDKAVPAELDVHCIVDNYGSHKHLKVKAWLAARPRWHMHFIPTYSSWLNQVEPAVSISSFPTTTKTANRLCGPPPLTPSSKSYTDFVRESAERDTSFGCWRHEPTDMFRSHSPSTSSAALRSRRSSLPRRARKRWRDSTVITSSVVASVGISLRMISGTIPRPERCLRKALAMPCGTLDRGNSIRHEFVRSNGTRS